MQVPPVSMCTSKFSTALCEDSLDTSWVRVGRVKMLQAVNFLVGNGSLSDAVTLYAYSEVQVTAHFCKRRKPIIYRYFCLISFDSAGWRKGTEGAVSTKTFSDLSSQRLLCYILLQPQQLCIFPKSLQNLVHLRLEGILQAGICKAIALKNQSLLLRHPIFFQQLKLLLLVSAKATFLRIN